MPDEVTIEDLNLILDLGSLHGKVDQFVCQTSVNGTQQIKVYTDDTYKNNAINTALRIRARQIWSYVMSNWNPQIDYDFRDKLKGVYNDTIYLFYIGSVCLKAQYFQITLNHIYTFINRTTEEIIYSGYLAPDQSINFEETGTTQYFIDCYKADQLFSSVEIKIVSELFNIETYYKDLFNT